MLLFKGLVAVGHNVVNYGVTHQNGVDVSEVGSQLVVKRHETQGEVDLFTSADWLLGQNNRLNLLIDLQKHLDVAGVEELVVLEQGLQFEETELLHRLGRRDIKALANDLDAQLQGVFDLRLVNGRSVA